MHSVRQSRSRILFEVLCALAISASCVGAWMQTGASALLPAAAVSALYGLIHAFDMVGRRAAVAVEPQRIDFATNDQGDVPAYEDAGAPLVATGQQLETGIGEAKLVVPPTPSAKASRRAKVPRKDGSGRRVSVHKKAGVTELAPLEKTEIAPIHPQAAEADSPMGPEEVAHPYIEALFEPEPFARMPRRAFGRKAG